MHTSLALFVKLVCGIPSFLVKATPYACMIILFLMAIFAFFFAYPVAILLWIPSLGWSWEIAKAATNFYKLDGNVKPFSSMKTFQETRKWLGV